MFCIVFWGHCHQYVSVQYCLKVRGNNLLICEVKRKACYLEKDVSLFTILFSIMYMYIISYTCTVYHCLHVHTFAVVAVCVCVLASLEEALGRCNMTTFGNLQTGPYHSAFRQMPF